MSSAVCLKVCLEQLTLIVQVVGFTFQPGELCALTLAGNVDQPASRLGIVERCDRQLFEQPSLNLADRLGMLGLGCFSKARHCCLFSAGRLLPFLCSESAPCA